MATATTRVVTTLPLLADWAGEVGGEAVEARSLVPPGADLHQYEPTAAALRELRRAEVVVALGLGVDVWLSDYLQSSGFRGTVVILGEAIPEKKLLRAGEPYWETMQPFHEASDLPPCCRDQGAEYRAAWEELVVRLDAYGVDHGKAGVHCDSCGHGAGVDPHVWYDPQLVVPMVWALADAMREEAEPNHAQFQRNAASYLAEVLEVQEVLTAQVAQIPVDKRIMIAEHDKLRYFGRRFGLITPVSILGRVSTEGTDPGARDFRELIAFVEAFEVPAVFADAAGSQRLARQLAAAAGLPEPVSLHESLSDAAGPVPSYLDWLRVNGEAIVAALR